MANSAQSDIAANTAYLQGDRGTDTLRQIENRNHGAQPRLLVVDDDEAIRELLSAMLTEKGYETAAAEDGLQALELLPQFRPDLVVTDLRMPRMSGFELLKIVREQFPRVPVIVVSGEFLPDEMPTSVNADAFIPKGGGFLGALEAKITELLPSY